MQEFLLHINGTGNAWPVPLGGEHPFYQRQDYAELANSSVSLISRENNIILSELLIDAGHGIVQHLLRVRNRIPEALVLTHPHLDHSLSLDWIAQSYSRKWEKTKKYPVYCSLNCFEGVLSSFPHLEHILEFKELEYGVERKVEEIPYCSLVALPVYHGPSAYGSSAILVKINGEDKILHTGDILCPMFCESDYQRMYNIPCLIADGNNRFPYPSSNHWSVLDSSSGRKEISPRLLDFIRETDPEKMKIVHMKQGRLPEYIKKWSEERPVEHIITSLKQFVKKVKPQRILLTHYSGDEDYRYYTEAKMNREELQEWLGTVFSSTSASTEFLVPASGNEFEL